MRNMIYGVLVAACLVNCPGSVDVQLLPLGLQNLALVEEAREIGSVKLGDNVMYQNTYIENLSENLASSISVTNKLHAESSQVEQLALPLR